SGASQATIGKGQAIGTILNDDPAPLVSINDVRVTEGNVGTTPAVFTISLSAPSGQEVSVDFATADGTAVAPGDYQGASGTLQFRAQADGGANVKPSGLTLASPTIARAGNQIAVSWPAELASYRLQASDSIGAGGSWVTVGTKPVLQGNVYQVVLPAGKTSQ